MIDKEAIATIAASHGLNAANSALRDPSEQDLAALHKDQRIEDLERYMPMRRRARGKVSTSLIDSFAAYVKDHKEPGCTIFIDPRLIEAQAILNLGTPNQPGHADNTAHLKLTKTPAYADLLTRSDSTSISQQNAAEWMEDWQDIIKFHSEWDHEDIANAVGDFNPKALSARAAIAAIRNLSIEQARKDTSQIGNLNAQSGTLQSIAAKSIHTIPTLLHVRAPAFEGLDSRTFQVRVGILTGGKEPAISLRIIRHAEHLEQMAKELEAKLHRHAALKDIPKHIGTYSRHD